MAQSTSVGYVVTGFLPNLLWYTNHNWYVS